MNGFLRRICFPFACRQFAGTVILLLVVFLSFQVPPEAQEVDVFIRFAAIVLGGTLYAADQIRLDTADR